MLPLAALPLVLALQANSPANELPVHSVETLRLTSGSWSPSCWSWSRATPS